MANCGSGRGGSLAAGRRHAGWRVVSAGGGLLPALGRTSIIDGRAARGRRRRRRCGRERVGGSSGGKGAGRRRSRKAEAEAASLPSTTSWGSPCSGVRHKVPRRLLRPPRAQLAEVLRSANLKGKSVHAVLCALHVSCRRANVNASMPHYPRICIFAYAAE